jgi:hypothetical protein
VNIGNKGWLENAYNNYAGVQEQPTLQFNIRMLIVSASLIIGSKIRKFLATTKNAVPAVDRVDVEPEADGAASPVAQLPGDDVLPAKLQRVFVAEAVAMKL